MSTVLNQLSNGVGPLSGMGVLCKGHELFGQVFRPFTGIFGSAQAFAYLLFRPSINLRKLDIPHYRRKQVVKIVSDSPCKSPQGLHFLSLPELGLKPFPFFFNQLSYGDISNGAHHSDGMSVCIKECHAPGTLPAVFAVSMTMTVFHLVWRVSIQVFLHALAHTVIIIRMDSGCPGFRCMHIQTLLYSEYLAAPIRRIGHALHYIPVPDAVAGSLQGKGQPFFTCPQRLLCLFTFKGLFLQLFDLLFKFFMGWFARHQVDPPVVPKQINSIRNAFSKSVPE